MGIGVIIYGRSGSGKSTSLRNFADDEIFLVNCGKKQLPFRKKFKYVAKTNDCRVIESQIRKMLKKTEGRVKSVVVDDATFTMVDKFMESCGGERTSDYSLYKDIAFGIWRLFDFTRDELPEDVIVYFMMHESLNDKGDISKLHTIGRLLDEKAHLEEMVTVTLRAANSAGRYYFQTNSRGGDIAKSPIGMFDSLEIENDLKKVDEAIRKYWLDEEEMNGEGEGGEDWLESGSGDDANADAEDAVGAGDA